MKTLIFFSFLILFALSGFAQGKIRFGNSTDYTFVFNQTHMYPADLSLEGQPIPASPLPSGVTLYASLYAGTASTSLALQTTVPLTAGNLSSPGIMSGVNLILSIPGGIPQYFRVTLGSEPPPFLGNFGFYNGWSNDGLNGGIFTATPGTSITYPTLLAGSPSLSTWLPGDFVVHGAPEPSTFALATLGLLTIALFRRAPPKARI